MNLPIHYNAPKQYDQDIALWHNLTKMRKDFDSPFQIQNPQHIGDFLILYHKPHGAISIPVF